LGSIITNKSIEVQNLNGQIRDKEESLETIKSECRGEAALLEGLRQQTAKYRNSYIIIKTMTKNISKS
jgi:hypothetical protein